MNTYNLFLSIITLIISAIFAGIEVAFIAADKLVLEIEETKYSFTSKIIKFILQKPSHILGTTLICTTFSIMISSSAMTEILESVIKPILPYYLQNDIFIVIVSTILITAITLLFAEFIPKSIFLINPNRFLKTFAIPLFILTIILYPIVSFIIFISKGILIYIFNQKLKTEKQEYELKDIHNFLQQNQHFEDLSPTNLRAKMASNAIEFKNIKVRDCIIPRNEIVAVDINTSIKSLHRAFVNSEHSKVLVYNKIIDDIVGYCFLKDLFKKPQSIKDILRPIKIFPETSFISEILIEFINDKKKLALIVDEFGGVSGIITMEDIIEQIFGEIKDEHDNEELVEEKISDTEYILSTRLTISYLNEKYQMELPEGDYDTLGGFIIKFSEKIPQNNEIIVIDKFKFTVLSTSISRINSIKLNINIPK